MAAKLLVCESDPTPRTDSPLGSTNQNRAPSFRISGWCCARRFGEVLRLEEIGRAAFSCVCGYLCGVRRLAAGGLRRSSHRATGGKSEKVWLKHWNLEGSCLQLLCGVVGEGWLSVLSVCRPKALQATPLQTMGEAELFSGGCYDGALQRQTAADGNSTGSGGSEASITRWGWPEL
jgi:hypothetical protein